MCQLPFTSINYGLDTTIEGRMVSRCLLEVAYNGIGKQHRIPVFPCVIFQLKKGINRYPGEPNYDLYQLALKCTAKRLYPNYANCDWSVQVNCVKLDRQVKADVLNSLNQEQLNYLVAFLKEHPDQQPLLGLTFDEDGQIQLNYEVTPLEEMGTMGCRTWNGFDINFKETYIRNILTVLSGKLLPEYVQTSGIQKDGRGNICPVTIILPELAMQAKMMPLPDGTDRIEEFFKLLDQKIHDAKDILLERFDCKALFTENSDALRDLLQKMVQDILEGEMENFLEAGPYERTESRRGYRIYDHL